MSYLSEFKNRQLSAKQALAKSMQWMADQVGRALTDNQVDAVVERLDRATDQLEPVLAALVAEAIPGLPIAARQVIAARATSAALEAVDTAISAAGAMAKASN